MIAHANLDLRPSSSDPPESGRALSNSETSKRVSGEDSILIHLLADASGYDSPMAQPEAQLQEALDDTNYLPKTASNMAITFSAGTPAWMLWTGAKT